MLYEILTNICLNYPKDPRSVFNDIDILGPNELRRAARITDSFKIYGGHGKGNTAQVPWILIGDKTITTSAQNGYYIVYLFNALGKGAYLSLNQGWTDYEKTFGIAQGKAEIMKSALYCRDLVRSSLENFPNMVIKLDAGTTLAKGYELGHICGKFYGVNAMPPDDVLVNDLRELMGIYAELKGYLSKYNVPITKLPSLVQSKMTTTESAEDMQYQKEIEKAQPISVPNKPQAKPSLLTEGEHEHYKKDPRVAKQVAEDNNYLCEYNTTHRTFISKVSGKNYVESHHLIPMSFQGQFQYSLDVPGNIISLCPTCHRLFHHAQDREKNEIIKHFHAKKARQLSEFGIFLSKEVLLTYYQ